MITWFSRKEKQVLQNEKKEGDDFVSLSSHQLRSPLSIIKWYTEILLDGDAGPLTEDQRKYLTIIESSNQRAIDLVRSLLNVSRLNLGTFSVSPVEMSVLEAVDEAINFFKKDAARKEVTIKEEKGVDKKIQADRHLCLMVIKTLLSNAIAFSKQGSSVTVTTALVPSNEKVGEVMISKESILVSIADSGIGIPDEDKGKIFSKLFRASNVKDSEGSDSGLGLYVVKTIVDYVGGQIWFTSVVNVGTTFYVIFPTEGMKKKEGTTTLD